MYVSCRNYLLNPNDYKPEYDDFIGNSEDDSDDDCVINDDSKFDCNLELFNAYKDFYNEMKKIPKDILIKNSYVNYTLVLSIENTIEGLKHKRASLGCHTDDTMKTMDEEKEIADIQNIIKDLDDEDSVNNSNLSAFNGVLTDELREDINRKKLIAMRRRLNSFDLCCFDNVPKHIIEAFFSRNSYRTRGITACFGFLNGIQCEDLFKLYHWPVLSPDARRKIIAIYEYLVPNGSQWYSYCTLTNQVMYCNGDLRINGHRVHPSNKN